jgi:hypothetical protein
LISGSGGFECLPEFLVRALSYIIFIQITPIY